MNRRENLKLLFTGSLASGLFMTGCGPEAPKEIAHAPVIGEGTKWGRTPEEMAHNAALKEDVFFTEGEMEKLNYLVDVIIPKDDVSGSATDAGVPDFIEFIVKDMPHYQTPMRGGLMWLDNQADDRFGKTFMEASTEERIQIIDDIAYPDKAKPAMSRGVKFFNTLRDLTSTGFFTSQEGFKDLDYKGNRPNVWDGIPDEVMAKHGFKLEEKYIPIYMNPDTRATLAQWDDEGNLIG
ncbi:gluconate 2-dehydrogenase subunit 3 family protein [Echinicola sp. CAU 1574]|uniref:Gluconate 2-dehydrogenase subunit 3 family protein n=1 Tax=Echinicola arenosa TaxID=2774144 RepID=A0ABR9ALJ2_9BACT|nr:gluconate 2-dehydrogenase subunit 3 family protein [Echinicola arenosa]MBD8489668.1 gluconate 2-dehydrogenase subunit 3 family protein [Echinicola arenosa]